jgi:hypothetical protein
MFPEKFWKNINGIHIDFIPHKRQRLGLAQDYFVRKKILHIRISKTPSTDLFDLILSAFHELVEAVLLAGRMRLGTVDKWDLAHKDDIDPAGLPGCPYIREHRAALFVETILSHYLLHIDDYDDYGYFK